VWHLYLFPFLLSCPIEPWYLGRWGGRGERRLQKALSALHAACLAAVEIDLNLPVLVVSNPSELLCFILLSHAP
jgi:hypothetical protein